MLKKLLTLLIICALSAVMAQEAAPAPPAADDAKPAEGKPAREQRRTRSAEHNRGGGNTEFFVSRMRAVSEKIIKKYDLDGDGKLSDTEKAALQKDLKTVEEFMEIANIFQVRQLQAADTDGDFCISDEEAEKIDLQKIRESAMPRNRLQGPGRQAPDQVGPKGRRQKAAPAPDAPAAPAAE